MQVYVVPSKAAVMDAVKVSVRRKGRDHIAERAYRDDGGSPVCLGSHALDYLVQDVLLPVAEENLETMKAHAKRMSWAMPDNVEVWAADDERWLLQDILGLHDARMPAPPVDKRRTWGEVQDMLIEHYGEDGTKTDLPIHPQTNYVSLDNFYKAQMKQITSTTHDPSVASEDEACPQSK